MATTYKVLGQAAPAATTNSNLYTAPSATSAISSTMVICNRSSSAATFRVAVRPAGATIANEHYVVYDTTIAGNDSIFLTLGVSLAATDVVTVYASTANVSFTLFGAEIV
jgi:hypothetical protein